MYSGVWTPVKEDTEKGIVRLKAGYADRRLEAALPWVLNLTVPSNINLLKTDSRLTIIAS